VHLGFDREIQNKKQVKELGVHEEITSRYCFNKEDRRKTQNM